MRRLGRHDLRSRLPARNARRGRRRRAARQRGHPVRPRGGDGPARGGVRQRAPRGDGLKRRGPRADDRTMLAALAAVPPLIAAALLWRANRALRAGAHAAADADPVTGLLGRPRFLADLDARLAGTSSTTLLLARIDGFAAYDSAFDHRERSVASALSAQGTGFAVAASCGRVGLPSEATTAAEALRLADARADLARRAADPKPRDASPTSALAEALALTGDHALGACELAEAVARRMGMSALERAHVRLAAQLSGLGKLAIPDTLLRKAGDLTGAELDYVRDHPVIAERILLRARGLEAVAAIVRSSREHVDGSGHPDGMVASEIPLGSRIVAVCDAFDAMLSHRPWRPAMSTEEALSELRDGAGSQFDPAVVDAFEAVLPEA